MHVHLLLAVVGAVSASVPCLALGSLLLALTASVDHVHVSLSLILSLLSGVGGQSRLTLVSILKLIFVFNDHFTEQGAFLALGVDAR